MEQAIRDRFNDKILQEAVDRYGIEPDTLHELGGWESFMYGYSRNGRDYILRLGHSRRRTPDLIRGEVDWINYLAAGGAGVARAVDSERGHLVEEIDDQQGGAFLATAFVKAEGGTVTQMGGWSEALVTEYGRLLGRIHHLSRDYTLSNPAWQRPHWDDPIMLYTLFLPPHEVEAQRKAEAVLAHLRALPRTPDGYGMIHQDAHGGNFFVDENGRITLFDFDDCVYGHFIYDIAMVLFYAVTNREDAEEFGRWFWPVFWRGYRQEYDLDPLWLAQIQPFLKLRELDLYAVLLKDVEPEELTADSWAGQFMHGRKERIINDVPYLNIDFAALAA